MDFFRSKYGLQGAVGFVSCQDRSSVFFRFIIAITYYLPQILNLMTTSVL